MHLNNFFRQKINHIKELKLHFKYYSLFKRTTESQKLCISMIDGRFAHGGLSDRLKGALSLFAYCRATHQEFRLNFSSPFNIADYLSPNKYNWLFRDDEKISDSFWNVKILILTSEYKGERLLNLHIKKQLHYYNNLDIIDVVNLKYGTQYTYGGLFNELFTPTFVLQQLINEHKNKIGKSYVAAVFRFQQLLGDFQEYNFPELEENRRLNLMECCRKSIVDLMVQYPQMKCLVTSDSSTFLSYISDLENVYVLPGKVVHMDVTKDATYSVYLKSFLDLYMISEAEKVFCIGTKDMYPSEFPLYAALINNVPFFRIQI